MAFFSGGGSLPLSGYVLRPPALRAYAATPSVYPHTCPLSLALNTFSSTLSSPKASTSTSK